jgi:hypothetical protein
MVSSSLDQRGGVLEMGCHKCDTVQQEGTETYPYRIGNEEIGWSAILIVACRDHAKLAIDRLNGVEKK